MPRCHSCGSQNVSYIGIQEEEPSVGIMTTMYVYRCESNHNFMSVHPPEQNKYRPFPVRADEKEILLGKIREIVGRDIPNLRWTLRALSHPDVIEYTKRYFNEMDVNSRCTKYEAPWSCAREAEARYENITFGFLGAGSGIGFDESWCENCRKKVME